MGMNSCGLEIASRGVAEMFWFLVFVVAALYVTHVIR